MLRYQVRKKFVVFLTLLFLAGNLSPAVKNVGSLFGPQEVKAATFTMQTGYYIGNGSDNRGITGIGFQPNMVIVKAEAAQFTAVRTSSMSSENTALFAASADVSTDVIQSLNADGFTVGTHASVNSSGTRYVWVAFGGSDCTGTGTFCVGTYTGNGSSSRALTSVGFQPDLVVIKGATAVDAVWKNSNMSTNTTQYLSNVNEVTTTGLIHTLDATGFTIGSGANVNTNSTTYWFFAFKQVTGTMKVGTYTGNGSDNRALTGVGFQPNFVFTKGADNSTAQHGVLNITEMYGDNTPIFQATAPATDRIQSLDSDGFTLGTSANVNENTKTYYYAAFDGASTPSTSGNFSFASGIYVGTGSSKSITGVPFSPDLVIVRASNATQYAVFRTSTMLGDSTAYFANAATNFTGGITSLDANGFTVGTSGTVNTASTRYHWYAFGGAVEPGAASGATDFIVGRYIGTGTDNRDVTHLPWTPSAVVIKGEAAAEGMWRTTSHPGDSTSYFTSSGNDTTDFVQSISTNAFQLGTNSGVNGSGNTYHWFAFKAGSYFSTGVFQGFTNYAYNNSIGFEPDFLIHKARTTSSALMFGNQSPENVSLDFGSFSAPTSDAIHHTLGKGYVVGGSGNFANTDNAYMAWRNPSPKIKVQTGYYNGDGVDNRAFTGIGFQPDLVVIKDDDATGSDGVLFKTSAMSGESTAKLGDNEVEITTNVIQSLDSDGFTVGTSTDINSTNIRYHWLAVGGSDCTSTGYFCVGSYTGNGGATQAITSVGFQPDLVIVKGNLATGENIWRSSDMATNSTNFFAAVNEDTTGAGVQTLDSTGFTVGNSIHVNQNTTTYRYIAFRKLAGIFNTGSFTGNATDNRNINDPGLGFTPDYVMVKNSNNTTPQQGAYNLREHWGDHSNNFTDSTKVTDVIQALSENGFQVGAGAVANGSGNTIYYWGLAGAKNQNANGSYKMAVGTYTGNGTSQSITGLAFAPDLVIVKAESAAEQSVFRTRMMKSTTSCYILNAVACLTTAVTALNSDGFSVGAATQVNTNTTVYHYQAFGNAYNPETNTGAFNFTIGMSFGSGIDSRDMGMTAFKPDMVMFKGDTTQAAAWRTASQSGDLTMHFSSTAPAANIVQAMNTNGVQVGTSALTNSSAVKYYWFAFRSGPDFRTGSYTGATGTLNVTSPNIDPGLIWVKKNSATSGLAIMKPSTRTGDNTQFFGAVASATGKITGFLTNGFSVGTAATTNEANTNAVVGYFAVWKIPVTYTQNDFEWMVTTTSVTLTNIWPPGAGTNLAENEVFTNTPSSKEPLNNGDKIRIQMNVTVAGSTLGASAVKFRLQYAQTTDCTSGSNTWIPVGDVGSGAVWRLFDEGTIGPTTTQVNDISTSSSTAEGNYSEINPAAVNPNEVLVTENTEWDWPVENNTAPQNTTYCFRMVQVTANGETAIDTYNSDGYPKLTTYVAASGPVTEDLMRHGKYFSGGSEQGFYWAL